MPGTHFSFIIEIGNGDKDMASGFTDKFSVRVKKEREKIKNQKGFKAKASYIWDYYKVPILAVIIGVVAVISIMCSIRANNYNTSLYVSYVNCVSVDLRDGTKILDRKLTNWLGIDGVNDRVSVDGYYQIDPDTLTEETYASSQKLSVLIVAKNSDCYIGDEVFTKAWANSGYLMDFNEFLPAELLSKVSGRLIYCVDGESGEEKAVGIDLDGLPFITDVLVFGNQHPIFSVVANAPHPDNCITFLEHIIDYEE